jgi:hypothetical protein
MTSQPNHGHNATIWLLGSPIKDLISSIAGLMNGKPLFDHPP